jgi:hypothetical protein
MRREYAAYDGDATLSRSRSAAARARQCSLSRLSTLGDKHDNVGSVVRELIVRSSDGRNQLIRRW